MFEHLNGAGLAKLFQVLKDFSGLILPLIGFLIFLFVAPRFFRTAARKTLAAPVRGDEHPGWLARAGASFVRAFTTNWQLTLLATTAFVLSLASGWTTWDGMRNFTGEPILSLMVTFGIQGVMLIIAWLIGESFAGGMNQRSQEARGRSTGEWVAGMGIGILFAFALMTAIANSLGAFDMRAAAGSTTWSSFADKALYLAVGLLLVATLIINNKSDIAQPYLQSARIMAKNAVLWVMFLACMATSVFFSFDSLFTSIFPASERKRSADIRAVNQVAAVVSDIGSLTQRRQLEEAERLFQNDGWKAYEKTLADLFRQSQGAETEIEQYFVRKMETHRSSIKEQQERIASSQSGQAGLVSKKGTLTDELSRLRAERPGLATELSKVKSELEERARGIDAKRVDAMAEEKGAEGTLKIGRGPQYRERVGEMSRTPGRLQDSGRARP